MWHDSICNTVQEPTVTSTIVAKKTTTWGESGFPSEFLGDRSKEPIKTYLTALIDRDSTRAKQFLDTQQDYYSYDKIAEAVAELPAVGRTIADTLFRNTLVIRACQHYRWETRIAALRVLADKWPDQATRMLLTERAVQDDHESARIAALRALADKWLDQTTRMLLTERAVDARLSPDGRAESGFVLAKIHSGFGRIVFTRDRDGFPPYLDPAKPISQQHIDWSAVRAGVPVVHLDDIILSLSAHLVWDIVAGAAASGQHPGHS